MQPQVVADAGEHDAVEASGPGVSQPTKLIRMASMTRAMLDEVRQAPPDDAGRKRLLAIYERSLEQIREALSSDLQEELETMFLPLRDENHPPSESEIRLAQAQLLGWLEGLFHGIQASLYSQQAAAQRQLMEMQHGQGTEADGDGHHYPGVYL